MERDQVVGMPRILIIDDDESMCGLLAKGNKKQQKNERIAVQEIARKVNSCQRVGRAVVLFGILPTLGIVFSRLLAQYKLPVDSKIKALSKGMRTKCALLVALARRPELLVLDETSDPVVVRRLLQSLTRPASRVHV